MSYSFNENWSITSFLSFVQQERENISIVNESPGFSLRSRGFGDGLLLLKYAPDESMMTNVFLNTSYRKNRQNNLLI